MPLCSSIRTKFEGAHLLTKLKMPTTPPTLNEVVRLITQIGGFLGRNGAGDSNATCAPSAASASRHPHRLPEGGW
jgi:hypothetical protein